jgi:hypothetical protein
MQQTRIPFGLIAQKQQALTVSVKPAYGVNAWGESERRERSPARPGFRGELRQETVWFVKGYQHGAEKTLFQKPKTAGSLF